MQAEVSVEEVKIDESASKTAQWRVYTDMGKKLAEQGRYYFLTFNVIAQEV